ncbi:MAG: 50S ribosomal protein L10 [Epsilonproteobacteria bacterium]|nr:50S ribosomal protein L10 [Campylobacterota bacterium]
MTKNKKIEIVNQLTDGFKTSEALVICDYKGLDTKTIEALRNAARVANVKVQVAKNTLASIAMKNSEIEGIELNKTNMFVWGEDQLDVTKVVAKFAEANKTFEIKIGFIAGEVADIAKIEALSKLPSRDELIGMLLQTWMAPVTNFTIGLDALRAKKEEEAA